MREIARSLDHYNREMATTAPVTCRTSLVPAAGIAAIAALTLSAQQQAAAVKLFPKCPV